MRILRPIVAVALVIYFTTAPLSGVALAQQQQGSSVVSAGDLDAALQGRLDRQRQTREQVIRVLQRSQVQQVAASLGIDLRNAESAVRTLDGQELDTVAAHAAALDDALSGGTVIQISLVAALLIIIIIILLVD